MLAKLAPWPPLAWIDADGDASLWIGLPAASLLALNWSCAATGLPRLALIFSLALHLVVLAGLPDPARPDRPPDPGPVQATLRLAPAPPLPLSRPAPPAGIPEARRLPPRPIALSAKAGTGAAAPPAAVPPAIPPADAAPAPEAGGSFPNVAQREETAASLAPPSAPAAAQAVPASGDGQALDDYRRSLFELLARHRQYPRLAALRGWEGEVRLRLRLAGKGGLLAVQVVGSSGYELLDQHALQQVQGAVLPALPDSFGDREIQLVVPIHYKLQKPT